MAAAPIDCRELSSGRAEHFADLFSVVAQPGQYARAGLPRDPFVAAVYEMAAGGLLLSAAAIMLGEVGELDAAAFAADSVAAWLYLVVAGSLVGFSAYAWLLRVAPIA